LRNVVIEDVVKNWKNVLLLMINNLHFSIPNFYCQHEALGQSSNQSTSFFKNKICTTKEIVSKLKRPPTEWEKIIASHTSDKGLITRVYRELKKLNSPTYQCPNKEMGKLADRI
jgi:hypothetical protein